jgi:iron complex outermembrane receptor protein
MTDENQYGARTTLTYRPPLAWFKDFALEGGLDVERQENKSLRYRTENRLPLAQTRDQHFNFETYGAYIQAIIEPIESLKVIPAYRIDRVDGRFTNSLNGQQATINDYGLIRQSKLSVVYSPWNAASLYGNWGRSFQVGAGAAAYKIPPRVADLAPSINDGWEAGVKFKPAAWLDGRVAHWMQAASDEVRRKLNDPNGDSDNVGKTHRHGYDVQINLRPERRTAIWLAYSRQYSRIVEPDPGAPATRGKEIDHVPNYLVSGGIDFQATPELRLSAWTYGQGNYYLERANTQGKFGGYMLFNLGASYQISKTVNLDFQVKNIANRYYEYVWTDGIQSLHSPGDGRAFYGTVSLKF